MPDEHGLARRRPHIADETPHLSGVYDAGDAWKALGIEGPLGPQTSP